MSYKSMSLENINIYDMLKDLGVRRLKFLGDNIQGCCPFHPDTRPSWGVSTVTGLWNCFGCGSKGDFISLISRLKDISYESAEELLTSDLMLKFKFNGTAKKSIQSKTKIYFPNDFTFVTEKTAPEYLLNRISFETIKHFKLGLTKEFKYDNYVIIPIVDERVAVGFVARALKKEAENRYLFPYGFDKKAHLFNYDYVKYHQYKSIILVEGVFDVMGCYDKGLKNVICIFGANELSDEHLLKLKNLTNLKNVIICMDSDDKGVKVANKIAKQLRGVYNLSRIDLPPNRDIDELTKPELIEVIKNRKHYISIGGSHV